jgi:hypothetical protein
MGACQGRGYTFKKRMGSLHQAILSAYQIKIAAQSPEIPDVIGSEAKLIWVSSVESIITLIRLMNTSLCISGI